MNPAGSIGGIAYGPYAWTNLGSGIHKLVNALAVVTNYWLDTEVGPHGSVNVGDGWQPKGGTLTITATADAYCHFTDWTGSEPGEENPFPLLMDEPKLIRANFAENLVPHATAPVPESWMAQ